MASKHRMSFSSEGDDEHLAPSADKRSASISTFTNSAAAMSVSGLRRSTKRARNNPAAPSMTAASSNTAQASSTFAGSGGLLTESVINHGPIYDRTSDEFILSGPHTLRQDQVVLDEEDTGQDLHPDLLSDIPPPIGVSTAVSLPVPRFLTTAVRARTLQQRKEHDDDSQCNEDDQSSEYLKKRAKRKGAAQLAVQLDVAQRQNEKSKDQAEGAALLIDQWQQYAEAVETNISTLQSVIANEYGLEIELLPLPERPATSMDALMSFTEQNGSDLSTAGSSGAFYTTPTPRLSMDNTARGRAQTTAACNEQNLLEERYKALKEEHSRLQSFAGGLEESLMTMGTIERFLVKLLKRKSNFIDTVCERMGIDIPRDLSVPEPEQELETPSPNDSGVDVQAQKGPEDSENAASVLVPSNAVESIDLGQRADTLTEWQGSEICGTELPGSLELATPRDTFSSGGGTQFDGPQMYGNPFRFARHPNFIVGVVGRENSFTYVQPTDEAYLPPQLPPQDHSSSLVSNTPSLPSSGISPNDIHSGNAPNFDGDINAAFAMVSNNMNTFRQDHGHLRMPESAFMEGAEKENVNFDWYHGQNIDYHCHENDGYDGTSASPHINMNNRSLMSFTDNTGPEPDNFMRLNY